MGLGDIVDLAVFVQWDNHGAAAFAELQVFFGGLADNVGFGEVHFGGHFGKATFLLGFESHRD